MNCWNLRDKDRNFRHTALIILTLSLTKYRCKKVEERLMACLVLTLRLDPRSKVAKDMQRLTMLCRGASLYLVNSTKRGFELAVCIDRPDSWFALVDKQLRITDVWLSLDWLQIWYNGIKRVLNSTHENARPWNPMPNLFSSECVACSYGKNI